MTNHSASAAGIILACALFGSFLFYSCSSNPAATTKTDTIQVGSQPTSRTATSGSPDFCLSSLSITGAAFAAYVPKQGNVNLILNYYLTDTCVTLRGWILKKGSEGSGSAKRDTGGYDPSKVLSFTIKPIKCLFVTSPAIVSNQVIVGKVVDKILEHIRKNPSAILHFNPSYTPSVGSKPGSVRYLIEVYAINRRQRKRLLLDTFQTNPAPPHQAFD